MCVCARMWCVCVRVSVWYACVCVRVVGARLGHIWWREKKEETQGQRLCSFGQVFLVENLFPDKEFVSDNGALGVK